MDLDGFEHGTDWVELRKRIQRIRFYADGFFKITIV
jgi:hypothetical protein